MRTGEELAAILGNAYRAEAKRLKAVDSTDRSIGEQAIFVLDVLVPALTPEERAAFWLGTARASEAFARMNAESAQATVLGFTDASDYTKMTLADKGFKLEK